MGEKSLKENLTELKNQLPKGYQQKIAEMLEGVAIWDVKRAFVGKLNNDEKLLKIFSAAVAIVEEYTKKQEDALAKYKRLKKIF